MSGDGHVMAFVSFQGIGVIDGQDLVVAVGDDDCRGAAFDAFLGTGGCAGIGAFGSALGVADPAIDSLGLCPCRRRRDTATAETTQRARYRSLAVSSMADSSFFWRPMAADCSNAPLRAFLCYLD